VIEALRDPDATVQMGAAYALADIGPDAREATPALQAALKDRDKGVREAADFALKKIN
jgi:HEAT repeat protein